MATPKVNIDYTLNFTKEQVPEKGTLFLVGHTEKGPVGTCDTLITTWAQFKELYGGLLSESKFPLICKKFLEDYGAKLRICKVAHYTDIEDPATIVDVKPTKLSFTNDSSDPLFEINTKYPGAAYNGMKVEVLAATNGKADYFNIKVTLGDTVELFENMVIPYVDSKGPTVAESLYLNKVQKGSTLVEVVYKNLSAIVTQTRPSNVEKTFTGGVSSDFADFNEDDFAGSPLTKSGFYAFDDFEDSYALAIPDEFTGMDIATESLIHTEGEAYCKKRKDLRYYCHIPNTENTVAKLKAYRTDLPYSKYIVVSGGGISLTDDRTDLPTETSELLCVLGGLVQVHSNPQLGEWYAISGPKYGAAPSGLILGVVNNYGTPGKFDELDDLSNYQINMVVKSDNVVYLSSGLTAQEEDNPEKFISVNNLEIYVARYLKPTLKEYLEDPLDFTLPDTIWKRVKTFFDELSSPVKRALFSYTWQGDQGVTSFSGLKINKPADFQLGKYKIKLTLVPIGPLQEINLTIEISQAGGVQINP